MPQTNPNAAGGEKAWRNSIERRFHALEVTVPTPKDSAFVGTLFDIRHLRDR